MARPNLRINAWYFAIYQHAETLLSTSLHVVAKIHAFFSELPEPAVLGRPSVGPRRLCPPSSVRSMGGGGRACSPRGTWRSPSGRHCVRNPEPYNGLSYAWGSVPRKMQKDGNPSPDCSPYGTAPPSPPRSCSTSSRPVTMSAGAGGSAPTYLPNSLLPSPPQYLLPSGVPLDPLG